MPPIKPLLVVQCNTVHCRWGHYGATNTSNTNVVAAAGVSIPSRAGNVWYVLQLISHIYSIKPIFCQNNPAKSLLWMHLHHFPNPYILWPIVHKSLCWFDFSYFYNLLDIDSGQVNMLCAIRVAQQFAVDVIHTSAIRNPTTLDTALDLGPSEKYWSYSGLHVQSPVLTVPSICHTPGIELYEMMFKTEIYKYQ